MKLFRLSLMLGLALCSSFTDARSDDCSAVDMRAEGGSMEGIQPMSQGGQGLCYAYASAELVDAWSCAHLSPRTTEAIKGLQRTSPIALAVATRAAGFNHDSRESSSCNTGIGCSGKSPIDGGWVGDCVNYLRSKGAQVCDHRKAFGESTISYDVYGTEKDQYEIIPGTPFYFETTNQVTKTGLGMGGTFDSGIRLGGSRHVEVGFLGRDSDYLSTLLKSYDDYRALLNKPFAVGQDAAGQTSLKLTCDLYEVGVPKDLVVGDLKGNLNPVLRDILAASATESKAQFLKRYLDAACKGKTFAIVPPLPALHEEHFYPEDGKHNTSAIVSYLNQRLGMPGSLPVEIGYCASVLYGSSHFAGLASQPTEVTKPDGTKENTRCLRKSGADETPATTPLAKKNADVNKKGTQTDPSDHSSLVIGRKRAKNGACMFLVRNSWGASCERYVSDEPGYECEDKTGDIWVDAAKLAESIQDVSHFTP